MTDTAGYSDIVFGLFWLLGFPFSPRLADSAAGACIDHLTLKIKILRNL